MSSIRGFLGGLALVGFSVALCLVVFEAFLIVENRYPAPEVSVVEIAGSEYGFVARDGVEETFRTDNGTDDIFVIGDSMVAGVACAAGGEDFPAQLASTLADERPVYNLGAPGKNPADYIDFVDHLQLSPGDVVLVTLFDNDIHIFEENCAQIRRQATTYDVHEPAFCAADGAEPIDKTERSVLGRINNRVAGIKTVQLLKEGAVNVPFLRPYFYRAVQQGRWNDTESEELRWMLSSLQTLKEIVEGKGASIVFTYYPNTNAIDADDPRHRIWKDFIAHAEETTGLRIDDPYPYFIENAPSRSMVWSLTDKHPSCAAHGLMAEHVAELLRR